MVRALGRIKCARLFDLLVFSLVCTNVFYVVYHWKNNTSSGTYFTDDGVDVIAASARTSVNSQLRLALKDVIAAQLDDEVAAQPDDKPAAQPDGEVASQPDDKPAAQPDGKPVAQPDGKPAAQPDGEVVSQPDDKPAAQPDGKPAAQPDGKPAAQPDGKVATQPDDKPAAQHDDKPAAQHDNKPAAQPDDKPAPTAQNVARQMLTGKKPCPVTPPNLIGNLACNCDKVSAEFLDTQYQNIMLGGRLRPLHCKPDQRLALIIPYRDRYDHLHTLLNMLIPILSRQEADVTFFVVEQTNETYFNRAALQNVGFLEALKVGEFDCFIFHDVDLVPLNDFHLYRCGPNPIHFTSKIQSTQWTAKREMYKEYTGGVIAMTRQQYQTLNGNSNLYFGWGGEDDDLYERILNKKMVRVRANKAWALYQMLQHARQEVKGENPQRFEVLKTARKRQDIEGLNSCKYTVNSIQHKRLYVWLNVSLNNTEILKTAPSYTLENIMAVLKKIRRAPGEDMNQTNTATQENQHTLSRETSSSIQGMQNKSATAR